MGRGTEATGRASRWLPAFPLPPAAGTQPERAGKRVWLCGPEGGDSPAGPSSSPRPATHDPGGLAQAVSWGEVPVPVGGCVPARPSTQVLRRADVLRQLSALTLQALPPVPGGHHAPTLSTVCLRTPGREARQLRAGREASDGPPAAPGRPRATGCRLAFAPPPMPGRGVRRRHGLQTEPRHAGDGKRKKMPWEGKQWSPRSNRLKSPKSTLRYLCCPFFIKPTRSVHTWSVCGARLTPCRRRRAKAVTLAFAKIAQSSRWNGSSFFMNRGRPWGGPARGSSSQLDMSCCSPLPGGALGRRRGSRRPWHPVRQPREQGAGTPGPPCFPSRGC